MANLRDQLPEGTRVQVLESGHEWLNSGDEGVIHWNHLRAALPTLRIDRGPNRTTSVQLVPGRDKVTKL